MDLVREFRRASVAIHVLHHTAERAVHGAWMSEELARHGYRISPGTLYPLLHRMSEAGLITGTEEVVDGRVRRSYQATRTGKRALTELRGVIRELADEVGAAQRPRARGRVGIA